MSFRPAGIAASLAGALSVAALLLCGSAAAAGAPPHLSAKAAIVIDARTGAVLFQQRADQRRPIASTTKLMTALLVLEHTNQRTVFTAPPYHPSPGESVIGLRKGERMNVHDLLRAMMLPSANDAAHALAVRVGHTEARFVRQMNAEARRLGLSQTHYSTPIGLDDPHNYSSARDLARLAMLDMRDKSFANIVGLPRAELLTGAHPRLVQNRNDLVLRYPLRGRREDGPHAGRRLRARGGRARARRVRDQRRARRPERGHARRGLARAAPLRARAVQARAARGGRQDGRAREGALARRQGEAHAQPQRASSRSAAAPRST